MKFHFFKILILVIILPNCLYANTQFFQEGLNLYKDKKFEKQNLSLNKI